MIFLFLFLYFGFKFNKILWHFKCIRTPNISLRESEFLDEKKCYNLNILFYDDYLFVSLDFPC